MLFLIFFVLISISFVSLTYLSYFVFVYNKGDEITRYLEKIAQYPQADFNPLPNISIIVPTYDEAKVIRRRLENIADLHYPVDRMEVIVIDDASKDGTADIAENALVSLGLYGKVLRNVNRIGLNASLNIAIQNTRNEVICITDADVLFEANALKKAVGILEEFEEAGGITGKIVPLLDKNNIITASEKSFRGYFNQSFLAESSLHSAFPGYGPLIVFKRSVIHSPIPVHYGSTDGNIAIEIVKSGYRFLYVPDAVVYERVPETVGQHRLQKVRRAKRLIQVFLHNMDVLFNRKYGKFGSTIYPLKFLMFVLCPIFMFLGVITVVVYIFLSGNVVLLYLSAFSTLFLVGVSSFSRLVRNFLFSFILHHFYLMLGLLSQHKKSHVWKKIERNEMHF